MSDHMSNSTVPTAEYEYYSHFLEDILTSTKKDNYALDYYRYIIRIMNDLKYNRIDTKIASNSLVLLQMMYNPTSEANSCKTSAYLSKNEKIYLHELFDSNLITLWNQ
jgi:hypothetical protein